MLPLTYAEIGEKNIIRKVGGSDEVKSHLADLGFVVGATVTVITSIGGNIIVNVKETRIALNQDMASKVMV